LVIWRFPLVIRRSFNGSTLVKPGAYSKIIVENLSGFPLSATGTVGIIGEAAGGEPGVIDILSGTEIQYAKARYKSGPIADALELLMNPSNDTRIVNGASTIMVWKTNNSTKATGLLKNEATVDLFSLETKNWGEDENRASTQVSQGSVKTTHATLEGTIAGPFDYSVFGGVQGVYSLTAVAEAGTMDGTYFLLPINATETEGFWMNVAGGTPVVPPALAGLATRTTGVPVAALDTAEIVRDALMLAINAKTGLVATNLLNVITVELAFIGATPTSGNGTSLFTVTEVTPGLGATVGSLLLDVNGIRYTYTTGLNKTAVTAAEAAADLNTPARWTPSFPAILASASPVGYVNLALTAGREYGQIGVDIASLMDVVVGWLGEARGVAGSYVITNKKDQLSEISPDLGGLAQFNIEYLGVATSCTLSISWVLNELVFATSCALLPADDLKIVLEDVNGLNKETISSLLTQINDGGKYSATFVGYQNLRNANELDLYNAIQIKNIPAVIHADNFDIAAWYKDISQYISATKIKTAMGHPAIMTDAALLSGGSQGSSTNTSYSNGFEAFKNQRINVVVPLISRDIGSVSIDSVNFMARSHCAWAWSTKGRNERSAFVSYRGTQAELQDHARKLNSAYIQVVGQQAQVLDKTSSVVWLDEWSGACVAAGMRAGAEVGEPLTFKIVNTFGFKVNDNSWSPKFNGEEMIEAGVLCFEQTESGASRVLLGNTTYGLDQSFVWNRESVVQAVGYVAYDLRTNLEQAFTGNKAKTGTAAAIANFVKARMTKYLNADITVGDDLNGGLGYRELSVAIDGNVAAININITPVQGIDFILPTIYVSDIRQTEVV